MAEGGGQDYKNMNDENEGSDDLRVKASESDPKIQKSETQPEEDKDKQIGPGHGNIETEQNVDTERAL